MLDACVEPSRHHTTFPTAPFRTTPSSSRLQVELQLARARAWRHATRHAQQTSESHNLAWRTTPKSMQWPYGAAAAASGETLDCTTIAVAGLRKHTLLLSICQPPHGAPAFTYRSQEPRFAIYASAYSSRIAAGACRPSTVLCCLPWGHDRYVVEVQRRLLASFTPRRDRPPSCVVTSLPAAFEGNWNTQRRQRHADPFRV